MKLIYYISHPQVTIEPGKPVPEWSLSDIGCERLKCIAGNTWIKEIRHIYSSDEVKAVETAEAISGHGNTPVTILPQTGEIDRSSTGYVTHERHEELADLCFGSPELSAFGWESAIDAQARIFLNVENTLNDCGSSGPIAIIGHGGVGTLLACKLGKMAISRRHDQPGGGHVFAFEWPTGNLLFKWVPIEEVSTPAGY